MAITPTQARTVTGLYSLARQSGMLESTIGARLFSASYFMYKRYLEDPFAGLARRHPHLFRNGDILDIGANIGYTAALFAASADPDATIYAFEPEPFNFRLLQDNIRRRKLQGRVTTVQAAVGSADGEIELWINEHHHADHRIATDRLRTSENRAQDGYVSVPIFAIDSFLARQPTARPITLIKIDVQGYESQVCAGMVQTVENNPQATIAVEYMPAAMQDLGYDPLSLLNWLEQHRFKLYTLGKSGTLSEGVSDELTTKGYVDLVCIR